MGDGLPSTTVQAMPAQPPGSTLLDVREDDEWASGHASGAAHVPLAKLAAGLGELDLVSAVHVVCRGGDGPG